MTWDEKMEHVEFPERGARIVFRVSGTEHMLRPAHAESLAVALIQATPPDDQQAADVSDGDDDHLLLFGRTKIHRDDAIRLGLALIRAAKEAK